MDVKLGPFIKEVDGVKYYNGANLAYDANAHLSLTGTVGVIDTTTSIGLGTGQTDQTVGTSNMVKVQAGLGVKIG